MQDDTKNQIITSPPKRELRVVQDDSPMGYLLDTARFEHTQRIAQLMARASLLPEHMRGSSFEETMANSFLVVNQALRWGFDPFSVVPETYAMKGKLGYQGKLIAAVVNARAGLEARLSYAFNDKKGDEMAVTVSGTFKGSASPCEITLTVGQAKTANEMWRKQPDQKLCYTGAIMWARRYCPEVVLGVFTDDDMDRLSEKQLEPRERPKFLPAVAPEQAAEKFKEMKQAVAVPVPPASDPAPEAEKPKRTLRRIFNPVPAAEAPAEAPKPQAPEPVELPLPGTEQAKPTPAPAPPAPTRPPAASVAHGELRKLHPEASDEQLVAVFHSYNLGVGCIAFNQITIADAQTALGDPKSFTTTLAELAAARG